MATNSLGTTPGRQPMAIFVQLTTACNARCITCPHPFTYGRNGTHEKGQMPDAVWRKLVGDLQRAGYQGQVGLYLHHEPLLARNLFSRIRDVNESTGAHVVLSTNAALLTAESRRRLIDACPRQVHININSAEREQYERMMGLPFETTFENARRFIEEAAGKVRVEINCPVVEGVDTHKLVEAFPGVQVNVEFWANSRGGLVPECDTTERNSRFKLEPFCMQPIVNFNVLWDGSVVVCCMDWAHESKGDFPSIMEQDLFEIYSGPAMQAVRREFVGGNYNRYRMCGMCAREMGFRIDDQNLDATGGTRCSRVQPGSANIVKLETV